MTISKTISEQHQASYPITGVWAASLTPLKEDLSCDIRAMANHCQELIQRGCSGVVIFGTTGEGSSFSVEERIQTLRALIDVGLNPQQIIVGVSCCAISDVVQIAKEAVKRHCAALLILPPFFYKNVDDEGVIAFYREVILRVGDPEVKILLYHIPQMSGVPITSKIVRQLVAEFPQQVIGIKESEGNLRMIKELREQFPHFSLLAGSELLLTEAARLGAAGGIVGMANLFPELLCSLFAYGKNSAPADRKEEAVAVRDLLKQYPFIAAIKGIMEKKKGSAWHALRPPLIPLDERQRETLFEKIAKLLPN